MKYFLGPTFSYSHQALIQYLEPQPQKQSIKALSTINEIFTKIQKHSSSNALVPVENSIAGDVMDTFEGLFSLKYWILGEVIIPINHVLAGKSDLNLKQITKIYSHTQAINQCNHFLQNLTAERVLTDSTS